MRVDVDEPGSRHRAADVDHARRGLIDDRRDPRDRVAADCDVSLPPRAPRAVDDAGVVDQEVVGRLLRANGRDDQTGGHTDDDEEAHQNAHGVGF